MTVARDRSGRGALFEREIGEQPESLARLLANRTQAAEAARAIVAADPGLIRFVGRGTSANACLLGRQLFEVHLGIPAVQADLAFPMGPGTRKGLGKVVFIAVSQSGQSPDIVATMAAASDRGAVTVAITNDVASPLASACAHVIDIATGPELAVAASKTYTGQLLALHLVVDALRGGDGSRFAVIPSLVSTILGDPAVAQMVEPIADQLAAARSVLVAGAGYSRATAAEFALKLIETCYLPTLAFEVAEVLHGPIALADPSLAAVVVSGGAHERTNTQRLLEQLHPTGAAVSVIGSTEPGVAAIALPAQLDPDLAPLVEIVPLQQIVLVVARRMGTDPDAPRSISKVTRTP